MKPWLQGGTFQITKFQTNSKVITVIEYVRHYGPVILLPCMTTYSGNRSIYNFAVKDFWTLMLKQRIKFVLKLLIEQPDLLHRKFVLADIKDRYLII